MKQTFRTIYGGDWHAERHLDEVRALCRRHGVSPGDVAFIETLPQDDGPPYLRFGIYLSNEHGHRYVTCAPPPGDQLHAHHPGQCPIAMRTEDHRLVGELPEWWPSYAVEED